MKKLILTFAVVCVLCALTYAGPQPLPSGKEMMEAAQAPAACPNWSGFYVGAMGGYEYALIHPSMHITEDEPEDARKIEANGTAHLDTSGGHVGGLIGYNYQWNHWVFGLEADGAYVWARKSSDALFSTPDDPLRFNEGYFEATSVKTRYLFTVGPRIGYAFCKWLPYVTGGLAVGELDFQQRISERDDFDVRGGRSETNVGAFGGAGLQYAISNHWSARVQYEFVYVGSAGINYHFDPNDEHLFGASKVFLREHNASFALIYRF